MDADPSAKVAAERPDASAERNQAGRGEAVARLAGMLATFAATGDLEGARAMHEAIGRLLSPPAVTREGAAVVDLDAERRRRAVG